MSELRGAEAFGRIPDPSFRDRRVPERCTCICGGVLEYHPWISDATKMRTVAAHNRTRQHQEWARRQETMG